MQDVHIRVNIEIINHVKHIRFENYGLHKRNTICKHQCMNKFI